jgi:hypothetical protein
MSLYFIAHDDMITTTKMAKEISRSLNKENMLDFKAKFLQTEEVEACEKRSRR